MKLDRADAFSFIISTLRYAMGRRSYVVFESQCLFHKYKSLLAPWQIRTVYNIVAAEIYLSESKGKILGDKMDHARWRAFLKTKID